MANYFFTPVDPKKVRQIIVHLLVFSLSIFLGLVVLEHSYFKSFINAGLTVGIPAAFLAGIFFTSALTSPIGIAMFFLLGESHNIFVIAFIGAFGSVIGDSLILKYVGNTVTKDIEVFTAPLKKRIKFLHFLQRRIFSLPLFLLASLIIASPLPDELGIALLASIKIKPLYFLAFSYCVNFLGIVAISELGSLIH